MANPTNIIRNIPLDQVYPDPNQPRKLFDQAALTSWPHRSRPTA